MNRSLFTAFLSAVALSLSASSAPGPKAPALASSISLPETAMGPEGSLRAANTQEQPAIRKEAAVSSNWQPAGQGTYTDILFSDLYGKQPQTFTVEFEQNVDDPSIYRIPEVYANMDFSDYPGLQYVGSNTSPMVIHVYNDLYAYFEEFDTGVYSTYTAGTDDYHGEIRMLMQSTDLLAYNDMATLVAYLPESLCLVQNGNLTLEATFALEGKIWNNVLGLCFVTGTPYDKLFRGNQKGNFLISLPDAEEYDPDADWRDIGTALYTDTFTEGLYPGNPEYGTWEVKMQQNRYDGGLYRLVNPYEKWKSPSAAITYDKEHTYYMTIMMQQYEGFTLVGIPTFHTGIEIAGQGAYAVSNQAADVLKSSDFLTLYYYYNGCLGYMEDEGVITYPSHCLIDYDMYLNFYGYCGAFSYDNTFYSANSQGNFKLVMPGSNGGEDGSGAAAIGADDAAPVYFNLQGLRIDSPAKGELLIEKQGDKTRKIIF